MFHDALNSNVSKRFFTLSLCTGMKVNHNSVIETLRVYGSQCTASHDQLFLSEKSALCFDRGGIT